MTPPLPSNDLEQRAAGQRERLHNSVVELRSSVRERLDVHKAARTHLWQAAGTAGLIALALGYALAGAFTE
jgi:hypothetical protein